MFCVFFNLFATHHNMKYVYFFIYISVSCNFLFSSEAKDFDIGDVN